MSLGGPGATSEIIADLLRVTSAVWNLVSPFPWLSRCLGLMDGVSRWTSISMIYENNETLETWLWMSTFLLQIWVVP